MTRARASSRPRRRADPFSVEISLTHPSCAPTEISRRLFLEPTRAWTKGELFGGVAKSKSFWHALLAAGAGTTEYDAALERTVLFLSQNDAFFKEFRDSGGEAMLAINYPAVEKPKGIAFDSTLSASFLDVLSSRGLGLRIRVWTDNPNW